MNPISLPISTTDVRSFLLIDDDPIMGKLAECYLVQYFGAKLSIQHALTLDSALELLRKSVFSHILLDNRLPPFDNIYGVLPQLEPYIREARLTVISAAIDDLLILGPLPPQISEVIDKFDFKNQVLSGTFDNAPNDALQRAEARYG